MVFTWQGRLVEGLKEKGRCSIKRARRTGGRGLVESEEAVGMSSVSSSEIRTLANRRRAPRAPAASDTTQRRAPPPVSLARESQPPPPPV